MKRATAIICAVVFIVLMFSGCKNNVFVDDLGNTHKVEMKHGKPVQDKYGNMIEKYTDENGEKQEAVVTFPVAKMDGKHAIESAFLKNKKTKRFIQLALFCLIFLFIFVRKN